MSSTKAQYAKATTAAALFLFEEQISHMPVNILAILDRKPWGLCTYGELSEYSNCSIEDVCKALESEDGATIYDSESKNYTIAYNETKDPVRLQFTLAHEIAHIVLGHLMEESVVRARGNLALERYTFFEQEANAFARNVVAPPAILSDLRLADPSSISMVYGINYTCATLRMKFLRTDVYYLSQCFTHFFGLQRLDILQRKQFINYISTIGELRYCKFCNSICTSSPSS